MFRQNVRQYVLAFSSAPPETPVIPGALQTLRTDHELIVTVVNPNDDTLARLKSLQPSSMTDSPLGLEDAFINYLGEPGTTSFLMDGEGQEKK
jgi:hypothetical protein